MSLDERKEYIDQIRMRNRKLFEKKDLKKSQSPNKSIEGSQTRIQDMINDLTQELISDKVNLSTVDLDQPLGDFIMHKATLNAEQKQ